MQKHLPAAFPLWAGTFLIIEPGISQIYLSHDMTPSLVWTPDLHKQLCGSGPELKPFESFLEPKRFSMYLIGKKSRQKVTKFWLND